jgi:prepilin-type N-terminal cleavage/methylation domain-containing protein
MISRHLKSEIRNSSQGFTLIEIMTAVSIFLVVMTISMGSLVSIYDANRRSQSLRSLMGNLNLAVESMVKEIRFGNNYHCGTGGTLTSPSNCPSGDNFFSFLSSETKQTIYRLSGTSIEKSVGGGPYIAVTAPEIIIEDLRFYTVGAGTSGGDAALQPKVLVKIKGYAGTGKARSDFTLQTLVSQRSLDR